jgi:hypothetical protein
VSGRRLNIQIQDFISQIVSKKRTLVANGRRATSPLFPNHVARPRIRGLRRLRFDEPDVEMVVVAGLVSYTWNRVVIKEDLVHAEHPLTAEEIDEFGGQLV